MQVVAVSGVIVFSTRPVTPWLRSPCGAPVPASATPTSRTMVQGASKRMICQRSTLPGFPSCVRQNGGASMSSLQRVPGTLRSSCVVLGAVSAMPAGILERRDFAFGRAPQGDVLVAERARKHAARSDFVIPRYRVPGVEREWIFHL